MTNKHFEFGEIVHLSNGCPARLLDDCGDIILVAVILSGWGDPHRFIERCEIKEINTNDKTYYGG